MRKREHRGIERLTSGHTANKLQRGFQCCSVWFQNLSPSCPWWLQKSHSLLLVIGLQVFQSLTEEASQQHLCPALKSKAWWEAELRPLVPYGYHTLLIWTGPIDIRVLESFWSKWQMCDRNDIYVSSKCLERCCCKGSWHLACWGTVLFPCTAAMCVRLPPSDVVTPCNCHCSVLRILNARAFCTGGGWWWHRTWRTWRAWCRSCFFPGSGRWIIPSWILAQPALSYWEEVDR